MEGVNVVGVQFRKAGKLYDFSSGDADIRVGDHVVVETDRGPSLAKVARIKFEHAEALVDRALKPILRRASKKELEKKPRLSEDEVTRFTKDQAEKLELKMKVLRSEIQFGGNKIVVYFTAPGRIDFRNLVKELATGLKTRVELKQVGARDETKLLGGLGICGREYCCSTFLREFVPVSIRMAKNQNLALNPSKVSGGCGRLLCCLTYEDDVYTELRQNLPPRGTKVKFLDRDETGSVLRSDILNQLVLVETENGQQILVPLKTVEVIGKSSRESDDDDVHGEEWGEDIDLALLSGDDSLPMDGEGREGARARTQSGQQNRPGPSRGHERGDRSRNSEGNRGQSRHRDGGSGNDRGARGNQDPRPRNDGDRNQQRGPRPERPAENASGEARGDGQRRRRNRKRRGPKPSGGGGEGQPAS